MDTVEILERAIVVLDERGWCRNTFVDGKGRVCALGAIHVAMGKSSPVPDPRQPSVGVHEVTYAVRESIPGRDLLTRFNDQTAKSKRDVQRVFRKTIKRLKAENHE